MRTLATIVLCLLLLPIVAPILSSSASLIDAGQTEQINEKVVAWQQLSDGKVLMVTGSGTLSVNTFESGTHTAVWSLDLNVTANSARVDTGENLVSVSHTSGVVIIQMTQQIITQYINTSNPVDAVDWDDDGDVWIGYFPGQRRAEEWSGGIPSGVVTNSHSGGMTSMLVTSDGHVLTGGYDNRVKVHDNTGTLVQQLTDMTSAVNTLELDAQGRLLVGTAGGDLFRYNLSDYTYEMLSITSNPQLVYIEQMDFASYHVGTQSGEIIVVDVQTFQEGDMYDSSGKVIASLKGANGEVYIISGFTSSTRVRLYDIDSDGDGVTDALDAFPTNPSESLDSDGDGVGDNTDEFPNIPDESVDSDGDGVIDSYDYNGFDSRIQTKSQYTASLFSLNQIGSSNNWNKISTWNLGQIGASYAAINSNGELYVWGLNYGSLPVHDNKSLKAWENGEEYGFVISSPTRVRPNETWKDISLGFKFGIGYSTDGTFYSWGRNLSSQLGKGKPTTYETFSKPNIYLGEITQISAGDQQVGIINKDGKMRMIGSNDQGQLGTGATNDNTPKELDWDDITDVQMKNYLDKNVCIKYIAGFSFLHLLTFQTPIFYNK